MDDIFDEVGARLVNHSQDDAAFTKREGVIDRMFPYIFQASRRMSTRAISAWLMENEKIKLSQTTIAKALRESERYWQAIHDEVEPAARTFAAAHGVSVDHVLSSEDAFEALRNEPPMIAGSDMLSGRDAIEDAEGVLASRWFGRLDQGARDECLAAVHAAERREEGQTA